MKKIIIFKDRHGSVYYDASTKELVEKAYLHQFHNIKDNIFNVINNICKNYNGHCTTEAEIVTTINPF